MGANESSAKAAVAPRYAHMAGGATDAKIAAVHHFVSMGKNTASARHVVDPQSANMGSDATDASRVAARVFVHTGGNATYAKNVGVLRYGIYIGRMNQRSLWCLKLSGSATASNRTAPLETPVCIRITSSAPK